MARILTIEARPNARSSSLCELADGTWRATLRAPPVEGKANAELVALVATHFHCPKSRVTIRSGAGSRRKRVVVDA